MKVETICNIALIAILALAGYSALKAISGVVSMFSQPPAALVAKANVVSAPHISAQQYR
jgi:repressor of nif and glnA expression